MKFQQEAYQDMLHHTQHKFLTDESQFWLRQCVTSSVLSRMSCAIWLTTHLIRNLEIIIKTNCQNAMIKKFVWHFVV